MFLHASKIKSMNLKNEHILGLLKKSVECGPYFYFAVLPPLLHLHMQKSKTGNNFPSPQVMMTPYSQLVLSKIQRCLYKLLAES